jgi:CheY-like chemotaxis protein
VRSTAKLTAHEPHLRKPVTQFELLQHLVQHVVTAPGIRSRPGAAQPNAAAIAPEDGCQVLWVEDNPVNQMVGINMLKSIGCTVRLARDGLEALEALAHQRFDLVLMDCHMPNMDGFEATRLIRERDIRARASGERLPIIAVTANAQQGEQERCLAFGFDDYLSKPYKKRSLLELVARWTRAGAALA